MKSLFLSIQREIINIVRHPKYLFYMTAGWFFAFVFFLTFLQEGQPQKLPIAVVDHDGSYLSRRLCHELAATQGVEVVAVYENHQQARDAMQRQRIFAFLEIPKGTYNEVLGFKRPHIAIYANNAYLLGGSFSYKTLATMTKLASGAVQREILRKKGYDEKTIAGLIQPIELDTHAVSNPSINYQPYILTTMLPGILGVMLLLLMVFFISFWLTRPMERLCLTGGNLNVAIVGKLLPYTVWFGLMGVVGNLVFFGYCRYTFMGNFWMLALTMFLYLMAIQSMAIFIVGLLPEMHMSVCIAAIYGMLSFTMSGFSYPISAMPGGMQFFSAIFPLRYYYLTYVDIALYGSGIYQYLPHLIALVVFQIPGYIGIMLINRRLKREGVWDEYHSLSARQSDAPAIAQPMAHQPSADNTL